MNDFGNITALSVCVAALILVGWIFWTMVLIPGLRYRREARERRLAENNASLRCAHGVMKWSACGKCAEEFACLPTLRKSTGSSATDPFLPATGAIPGDTTAGGREKRPKSVTVEFAVEKEVLFDLNPAGDVIAKGNWVGIDSVFGKRELQANPPNWPVCGVCGARELDSHLKYVNHSPLRVCQKCFDLHYKGPPKASIGFYGHMQKVTNAAKPDYLAALRWGHEVVGKPTPLTLSELDARLRAVIKEAGYLDSISFENRVMSGQTLISITARLRKA